MNHRLFIHNVHIVNDGECFEGAVVIEGEQVAEVLRGETLPARPCDETLDGQGAYLLPGVIDDHVHFRDPGLTQKADMESESRAAAAGGVTSYMDMPNTVPQTTTLEAFEAKMADAARKSRVNYSFYFGATNTNTPLLKDLDKSRVCGVKLFMGSSTGNMLVDRMDALRTIFSEAGILIAAHCEDQSVIAENIKRCKALYGDDPDVSHHPEIRSAEACYRSSELAVRLARETGARLHIAHISTARELTLLEAAPLENKHITAEACIAHLYFSQDDYAKLGTRIKCNPAIKTVADRAALRHALTDGKIDIIATDHAPHLLKDKEGGALKAASGMPMLQFSLVTMLELADEGVLSLTDVVEKMCHAPARLFSIEGRGYIRPGYQADLVLVRPDCPWQVCKENILSKCGWSPMEGHTYRWKVERTFVNGHPVYAEGKVDDTCRGQALKFNRN